MLHILHALVDALWARLFPQMIIIWTRWQTEYIKNQLNSLQSEVHWQRSGRASERVRGGTCDVTIIHRFVECESKVELHVLWTHQIQQIARHAVWIIYFYLIFAFRILNSHRLCKHYNHFHYNFGCAALKQYAPHNRACICTCSLDVIHFLFVCFVRSLAIASINGKVLSLIKNILIVFRLPTFATRLLFSVSLLIQFFLILLQHKFIDWVRHEWYRNVARSTSATTNRYKNE